MDFDALFNAIFNGDITVLLQLLIYIIVAIISAYLIPIAKSKMSKNQQELLAYWLEMAVYAAEEAANANKIPKSEKLQYSIDFLNKKGIKYDKNTIEVMIDSKVRELINQFKDENIQKTYVASTIVKNIK